MSNLSNKSVINFESAKELQNKYYFSSVIHCAYYSCVQYVLHVLIENFKKTEKEIATEQNNLQMGKHEYLINTVTRKLKDDQKDWKSFNDNMNSLKKLRVKSDYENVGIDIQQGRNAITLSESILKQLKNNFR